MKFFYLALGGSIGATLRYLISIFSLKYMAWGLPMGTLTANLIGSFLIGFAFVFFGRDQIAINFKIFLFIGIFGSFTTFSSYMFESLEMFKNGFSKMAFLYIALSNIFGLLLVYLGYTIGELFEKQMS